MREWGVGVCEGKEEGTKLRRRGDGDYRSIGCGEAEMSGDEEWESDMQWEKR